MYTMISQILAIKDSWETRKSEREIKTLFLFKIEKMIDHA